MRTAMTHEKIGDLKVNTILTYCNPQHGEFQHMVDVWIPIVEGEADVKQYLDREYFPQLQKSMKLVLRPSKFRDRQARTSRFHLELC